MPLSLSFKPYRLPFQQPLHTAHGRWAERRGIWVRLEDEHARVGFGEIAPVPEFGGTSLAEATAVLVKLGETPSSAELAETIGRGGVLGFGLGGALADLEPDEPVHRDYVPVAGLLPAGKWVFPVLDQRLEMGFRTFKWKVGVADPKDEQVLLDDVCARLPEGSRLRLDANGRWERRVAERWLAICAERPMIEFVEQPTDPANADLLMGLAGEYPAKLALDEAVIDRGDFQRWRDRGWPGVFVIKPALWGDPADLLEIVADQTIDTVVSSALETVVGAKHVLRIGFASQANARAAGIGVWPLFEGAGFNGPTAVPFLRKKEVEAMEVSAAWEAQP